MKCFYHSADLDGHCSGAIVKHMHPGCEMVGIDYGDGFPMDRIGDGETVYMVDFSLQPFMPHMTELREKAHLIWVDHHKTAIQEWKDCSPDGKGLHISGIRRVGDAGCELTWEYFGGANVPRVVYYLGRYDVWDHSDQNVLPFQYGCRMENTDPENQVFWQPLFDGAPLDDILERGHTVLRYQVQQNEKIIKARGFDTSLDGLRVIACNAPLTNSQLFDSVWDQDRYDAMLTFCLLPSGQWTVSLYSDKDSIDVGTVAKARGGGGHKGAAGFQCDELPFNAK